MTVPNPGSVPARFSSQIIEAVNSALLPNARKVLERIRTSGNNRKALSIAEFLEILFARTPRESVLAKSSSELATICNGCLDTISRFEKDPDQILIEISSNSYGHGITVTLTDSPFIVNSIAEALTDLKIEVALFAHPIFFIDDHTIALSYVETQSLADDRQAELKIHIHQTLQLLKVVIADFGAMTDAAISVATKLESGLARSNFGEVDLDEIKSLLRWFTEGRLFLVGCASIEADKISTDIPSGLGVWRADVKSFLSPLAQDLFEDVEALKKSAAKLSIRKLRLASPVHRRSTLMHICIQTSNKPMTTFSLIGFLTSKAIAGEAEDTPLVRDKLNKVLQQEGVLVNSYDYKYIVDTVDEMPVSEVLCLDITSLRSIVRLAIDVFDTQVLRTLSFIDNLNRRLLVSIVIPTERFSPSVRAAINNIVEGAVDAIPGSSALYIDSSKRIHQRLYVSVPIPRGAKIDPSLTANESALSEAISRAALGWVEHLSEELQKQALFDERTETLIHTFSQDYQATTSIATAANDIREIIKLNGNQKIGVALSSHQNLAEEMDEITFYSRGMALSISNVVPILQNLGIHVSGAQSFAASPLRGDPVDILRMRVLTMDENSFDPDRFRTVIAPGLVEVLVGNAENDPLISLMRTVGLPLRSVRLLRAYCVHLWQVSKFATRRTTYNCLASQPHCAAHLWKMFDLRFNPTSKLTLDARIKEFTLEESKFIENLREVPDITYDRVLKALLSLLTNTVRTNFFQGHDAIVLKMLSQQIDIMPEPKPMFELFVMSAEIEGLHLRSSPVARGGIRWSERLEDYRSEVLGLMKTQKVKNVIIVPTGAKGGFIVKKLPKDPQEVPRAVEKGYREYIRALLTVADNRVGTDIIHPKELIIYDDPDPYFVVAADKGTATFSDIANQIATDEFGFWLGDAFASGGSHGYDHKKYGITAKGGWECVKRHFHDLGIDYQHSPFSVIGLGDMSGDVFGNGLLLSKNMLLIGAFNHKHIFLDPNPDPNISFEERKRLFSKARSQWSDYNPSLISTGGGIYNRFEKEIRISPEVRARLSIPQDISEVVEGEFLITLLLQAPADLLWNGGIGTYVKSSSESHAAVNDGTNDRLRINADQLRVRVVGEGGNLGFTQLARIEFSARGGRINTDAIDNSAGVDLSDHEVNLKLLFSELQRRGPVKREDRDEILIQISGDIVKSVLRHNCDQALMLTVAQELSKGTVESYQALIREMHRLGFINRSLDGLPDDEELSQRANDRVGLYRPELALCSAAVKMWLKENLRTSDLCDEPLLETFLLEYFPGPLRDRFSSDILKHPLRREIVTAELLNTMLPAVSIPFVHTMCRVHSTSPEAVLRCVMAADLILGTVSLRDGLRRFDTPSSSVAFIELWLEMSRTLTSATSWLISHHGTGVSLREIVALYGESFQTLVNHAGETFVGQERARFERRLERYKSVGLIAHESAQLAVFRRILPALEVLWSARECGHDVRLVAATYAQVLDALLVNIVLKYELIIDASNKWEQEVVASSYQEIRRSISLISVAILRKGIRSASEIDKILARSRGYDAVRSTILEIEENAQQRRPFRIAALSVLSRQLRLFEVV